ncbi:protoporphyrinogen/coproporphyrinogen oxidase [Microbacterium sp. bgisy189]|uniref:protoporphyrinogen/coproporphyrinogen oxidase n=1 Tax=Microbacterium sp. bgisy189 TaxID=3413798 RepID=UPI003EC0B99B
MGAVHADFEVIGGGVAGLVTARALARAGASVVLHEATDRLGGPVAAHEVAGLVLDAGAESFAVRGGTVAALLGELGLGDDIVAPRPGPAWLQPAAGDAVQLPATGLLGIPVDPLASDVIAVIGADAAARAAAWDAEPATDELPESLGELVRQRMGADLLDRLVAPVVHGVHSLHPDELAVARAHPGLPAALAEHGRLGPAIAAVRAAAPPGSAVAGIRGGMHRLITALADDARQTGVEIRLKSRVDDPTAVAGRAIVAAPGVAAPAAPGRRIVLATLVVDASWLDAAPRGSGLLVAHGAPGIQARALTHATTKWAWLREAAGDRHVVRLSYDVEPTGLEAVARADAEALLGGRFDAVDGFARIEWTRPAPAPASTLPTASALPTVGETVAGSGLAGIIAHAHRTVMGLLV